jgi:hypothetical protein
MVYSLRMPCRKHKEIGCIYGCSDCIYCCHNKGCTRRQLEIPRGRLKCCGRKCTREYYADLHKCTCQQCLKWKEMGGSNGIATVLYDKTKNKIICGLEIKAGRYHNMWNICTGSTERKDRGCFVNAAIRELWEEQNIVITREEYIQFMVGCICCGGTILTVIDISSLNISLEEKNIELEKRVADTTLPECCREIAKVAFVDLENRICSEGDVIYTPFTRYFFERYREILV